MALISGQQYIDRINQLKPEIWIEGKQVTGKLSEHPALKGIISSKARLYDIQVQKDMIDKMSFKTPSGERAGLAFFPPKTKEDLERRRIAIQEWAKSSGGLLGRSPDYLNTILMTFMQSAELLSSQDPKFSQNMLHLYKKATKNDLSFTHTFVHPQVNRGPFQFDFSEDPVAAHITKKTKDGIIIRGARLLATQGGLTDEIIVFPQGGLTDLRFANGFSIPANTPGLKFIARESFDYGKSHFDHPLGSRFDELDSVVVFDDVLVPWENIFFYENIELSNDIYNKSSFFQHTVHQVANRCIVKTEFILGTIQLMIQTINIGGYDHVQEKVADVIVALETMKALVLSSEIQAKIDRWGTMTPAKEPLHAALCYYAKIYPTFSDIIQKLGASGLVSIPGEKDFDSPIREDIDKYLQGANSNAEDRVKIFRLAWDLSMSAFGTRQSLYEQYFFGGPLSLSKRLYLNYYRDDQLNRVKAFLSITDEEEETAE
ncbi:4-hydroxyphenylacetate 3-monooxygenase, oxygenase component [Pseudalkalibacillus berkeleyi]|uniref:4-hydroxyphenylacetate 3-monooxygenase, oxygenase component n=1 Tax=Pseudalkalibacillus berkeleyi TaxID=1069813 RepID=A0ABS9GUG9_9BACL|nr:4-hydroxyphenylacetate 3-monooxygenase, oxygenase component [Pseudalkalibacillus berkeleyi]MCF6136329.1 4-hydroxyphenylacetate 3-monooxygenase, oxygenase component [Pseudalkalibacillus berkeleyi]